MKVNVATRNKLDSENSAIGCTEFVLHKSQQTIFNGIQNKIIDYTEHRLLRYVNNTKDVQQKMSLVVMVDDYKAGLIAIAWKNGKPLYIKVTRDSKIV